MHNIDRMAAASCQKMSPVSENLHNAQSYVKLIKIKAFKRQKIA